MAPPRKKSSRTATFNLVAWANSAGLDNKTISLLKKNGLNNTDILKQLQDSDLYNLGLPLAQTIVLRQAVQALHPPAGNQQSTVTTSSAPLSNLEESNMDTEAQDNSEDAGDLPDQIPPLTAAQAPATASLRADVSRLLQAGAQLDKGPMPWLDAPRLEEPAPLLVSDYDPRHILTVFSPDEKALKIADFLPASVQARVDQRKKEALRNRRPDTRRNPVQPEGMPSLTVAEWEAANMRLLTHLLRTGSLPRQHVDYYLSYTVQIMEFVNIYEWQSIIAFDNRYRDLQAYHKFVWGDMRNASQLGILKPRMPQAPTRLHQMAKGSNQTDQKVPDCKKWLNSGRTFCDYGDNCKFAHRPKPDNAPKNE